MSWATNITVPLLWNAARRIVVQGRPRFEVVKVLGMFGVLETLGMLEMLEICS